MKIKKILTGLVGGIVGLSAIPLAIAGATPSSSSSNTIIVTGDTAAAENQPGWMFNRDTSTSTPYEFNTAQHSIGNGSLYVKPIGTTPLDKFIAENFLLTPIANVNSISYDFRIGSGGVATQEEQFYMNVYANFGESSPTKFYDCRYNIVPTVGSTSGFTAVTFDPTQTYPVTTHGTSPHPCPASPSGMQALSLSGTASIRVFALNVGDTSTSDIGLDGYLDKVVVAKTSGTTTYDFEPLVGPPTSKDQCKHNGWKTFNNPSFKNQGKCEDYVKSHGKPKEVEGTLKMSGPSQKISFNVDDDHGWWHKNKKDTVEYWNYEYPENGGVLHYKAEVLCVGGEKFNKEARVMWQIPVNHPGLSGLYVVAYTKEVKNGPDLYGHAATASPSEATTWCETGTGFAPTMYTVTQGHVDVE